MEVVYKLVWTMAFMLRDLSKYGAVDISKLPESERAKFGVMFSLLDKQCHEVENPKYQPSKEEIERLWGGE